MELEFLLPLHYELLLSYVAFLLSAAPLDNFDAIVIWDAQDVTKLDPIGPRS